MDAHRGLSRRLALWAVLFPASLLVPACGGGGGGGGSGGGPTPFVVNFRLPANGAVLVPRTQVVYVRFNRAAKASTVTNVNITLSKAGSGVSATVAYVPSLFMAVLEATSVLDASSAYTVDVSAAVLDAADVPLTVDQFTFSTGAQTDITRPTGPTSLTPSGPSTTSIDLDWTAGSDDTDAAGDLVYDVFRSTTSGVFDFAVPTATTAAGATSATMSGLAPRTTYYFAVRARDTSGNVNQNATQVTLTTLTSFVQNAWPIVQGTCRSCHTAGGEGITAVPTMNYDTASTTRSTWVNQTITCSGGSIPGGAFRVKPGDPSLSFLYNKISQAVPWCGVRMPKDRPALSAEEQDVFFDWITEGALDN